jgi:hypothetical protein
LSKTEFDEYEELQMIYSYEEIKDKKDTENIDMDLLSRLTINSTSDIIPIDDYFSDESLLSLSPMPWFAKNINFVLQDFCQLTGVPKTKESFIEMTLTNLNIVLIKYFKDAFRTMR